MATDALLIWDILSVACSGYLCALVYAHFAAATSFSALVASDAAHLSMLGGLLAIFVLGGARREEFGSVEQNHSITRAVRNTAFRVVLLLGLLLAVMFLTRIDSEVPRLWMLMWATAMLGVTVGGRVLFVLWLRALQARGALSQRVAVLGSGLAAAQLAARLKRQRGSAIELAGIFDVDPDADGFETGCASLLALGQRHALDCVIIAMSEPAAERLQRMIMMLKALDVPVALCSEVMEVANATTRICQFGDVPMIMLVNRPIGTWGLFVKTCIDKLVSGLALLLLAPLLLLIAAAIRLDSPGPALFRQRRHGRNNTEFEVLKFRTMRMPKPDESVAGFQQTERNDKRVTRIGAYLRSWSLDELPQLLNVFRGEMSLVGPRPHACEMRTCDMLSTEIIAEYTHRHRVKPGLTGWAQINGHRGATHTPQQICRRVEHDLYYIDNWSLLLDLWIVLVTPTKVLFSRRNAY